MITKVGDIFSVERGIIAHGCNCQGVMGSGVARKVRDLYPEAYERYLKAYDAYQDQYGDTPPTGGVQLVKVSPDLFIANCLTQKNYGRSSARFVSYDAVDMCFSILAENAAEYNLPVHFPLIGGGLGNGDPDVLKRIFEVWFPDDSGTLWLLEEPND
jgi:O-acetyl-ADP-ribose deacetylase (regulator of RNase III)